MNVRYSLLGLLFVMAQVAVAQQMRCDTIFTTVNFERGYSVIDLDYKDNRSTLEGLSERLRTLSSDPGLSIDSVMVQGFASPDGLTSKNIILAEKRARNIVSYLSSVTPLPENLFSVESSGVDWEKLERMVGESAMPYRDEVLEIIRTVPVWVIRGGKIVDSRKRRLGMLHGGKPYNYMAENFFPSLRHADFRTIVCMTSVITTPSVSYKSEDDSVETLSPALEASTETVVERIADEAPAETPVTSGQQTGLPVAESKPGFLALKTNMLYDLAAVPNCGMEFYFCKKYSLSVNGMYAWWSNDARHRFYRIYGGDVELRRYLGGRRLFEGHHIGAYCQMLTYDFSFGRKGIMGDKWTYGAGLSYGYSLSLSNRLNIDFSIGIGYLWGKYKKYHPADGCYVWDSTNSRKWFGPTNAEISLVYVIGGKGGSR